MVKITFREYYKASKDAITNGLKIFGIVFSVVAVIIWIIFEWGNVYNLTETVKWFVICVLFGNGLGLVLVLIGLFGSYYDAKSTIRFFNRIPNSIKEHYALFMGDARTNTYDFPQFEILNHIPDSPVVQFRKLGKAVDRSRKYEKEMVGIILYAQLGENIDFNRKQLDLDRKYKEQHITLTGWGLKKTVSKKEWNTMREKDINVYLRELHEIADNEEMTVIKWGEAQEQVDKEKEQIMVIRD
jgi:hypothetical protein